MQSNNLSDYLKQLASQLGLERAGELAEIQTYLDTLYPGLCRAASLNEGVLKITTASASVASDLRMRQVEIKQATSISKLMISISSK